jgi:hypothetical protein
VLWVSWEEQGLTAVGNSHEDAKVTYERAVAVLDQEAGKSFEATG